MIRELLGLEQSDPSEYYPWECPHCNMAVTQGVREKLLAQDVFYHCPACGEEVHEQEVHGYD
jgi:DNA-directed RNA polymerase subunit RPC12/RpoP